MIVLNYRVSPTYVLVMSRRPLCKSDVKPEMEILLLSVNWLFDAEATGELWHVDHVGGREL